MEFKLSKTIITFDFLLIIEVRSNLDDAFDSLLIIEVRSNLDDLEHLLVTQSKI